MVPCFIVVLSTLDPLNPRLPVDILRDYTLEFEVRVNSTHRDLKECLIKAIKDKNCCKELLDATMKKNIFQHHHGIKNESTKKCICKNTKI